MSQTRQLELLLGALLAAEYPEVAKQAVVSVGYAHKRYVVSERADGRVSIRFLRQALEPQTFQDAVSCAARSAQQILLSEARQRRAAASRMELWMAAQRRLPCTD